MVSVKDYFNSGINVYSSNNVVSAVQSTSFTADLNQIYKIDTSITMTLPASPSEGDWVGVRLVNGYKPSKDGVLTLGRNGNEVFNAAEDGTWNLDMNFTLQYTTQNGWVSTTAKNNLVGSRAFIKFMGRR